MTRVFGLYMEEKKRIFSTLSSIDFDEFVNIPRPAYLIPECGMNIFIFIRFHYFTFIYCRSIETYL